LQRVEKVPVPETRATVNTYLTVEWGGQIKKSSIQYDNYQPIFNEEFYFEIPVKSSGFRFRSQADPYKNLRSELQTNNMIGIDLWLEGEDGTSDNLGSAILTIAEVQNAPKEPKMYFDYVTRREVKYVARNLETKKIMQSVNDQNGLAQLFVECWFLPDIPEEIDLSVYSNFPEDKFPIELDFTKRREDFEQTWSELSASNFSKAPLEGARVKNMKRLFSKDQYGKPHFLSKYLGKFTVDNCNEF